MRQLLDIIWLYILKCKVSKIMVKAKGAEEPKQIFSVTNMLSFIFAVTYFRWVFQETINYLILPYWKPAVKGKTNFRKGIKQNPLTEMRS